jgi:hypothetical protein
VSTWLRSATSRPPRTHRLRSLVPPFCRHRRDEFALSRVKKWDQMLTCVPAQIVCTRTEITLFAMNLLSRAVSLICPSLVLFALVGCANADEPIIRRDGGTGQDVRTGSCNAPMMTCSGSCVDLQVNTAHCGSCGNACAAGQTCSGGTCQAGGSCAAPRMMCGANCVDTSINDTHCGRCNNACTGGQICQGGTCTAGGGPCNAPRMMCGVACVDVSTSTTNCGSCGNQCMAGQTCTGGRCSGGGGGAARTGQTCAAEADCGMNAVSRGICQTASSGWAGGYCTYLCMANADCGAGGVCAFIEPVVVGGMMRNIGSCYTGCPTAGMRAGCRAGYACLMAPESPICVPDCQVAAGTCGANMCSAASGGCVQCRSSADCMGGGTCTIATGSCACTAGTNCGTGRTCRAGACVCNANSACPAGWTCNVAMGQCTPPA